MHKQLILAGTTALVWLCLNGARAQFQQTTTIGGYGELHYNEPDGSARGQLDFHRFVITLGHEFTEQLSFRSEVEIEHTKIEAGESRGGELSLEQAFLEYRFSPSLGVRAGILLPPVGIINQVHEPPTFNGVERPSVETVIIPSTWSEAGAGLFGSIMDGLSFQLEVVAGLDAAGFNASDGIGGGRQDAFESDPSNPSLTGRLEYVPVDGLTVGGSFFAGNSTAGHDSTGDAAVRLWSADARFTAAGFSFRWVGAVISIGDGKRINTEFAQHVADKLYGYSLEGSYDLLRLLSDKADQQLDLFARYEKFDTQASLTDLLPARQYNRNTIVVGATFKPVYNLALKADYAFLRNALHAGAFPNTGQFDLGIGYYF